MRRRLAWTARHFAQLDKAVASGLDTRGAAVFVPQRLNRGTLPPARHSRASYKGVIVGIFRKVTSMSTLGAVNFHAPRENQAIAAKKNAKSSAKEAKANSLVAAAQARLLEAQRRSMSAPAAPVPVSDAERVASASIVEQLERLAALRDQGVLTDEEFNTQKARLLA